MEQHSITLSPLEHHVVMTILLWLTLSHSAVHTQGVTARLSLSLAGQGWTLEVAAAAAQLPPAPAPARAVSPRWRCPGRVTLPPPRPVELSSPASRHKHVDMYMVTPGGEAPTCRYVHGYTK